MVTGKLLAIERLSGLVLIVRRAMLNTSSTLQLTWAIWAAGEKRQGAGSGCLELHTKGGCNWNRFWLPWTAYERRVEETRRGDELLSRGEGGRGEGTSWADVFWLSLLCSFLAAAVGLDSFVIAQIREKRGRWEVRVSKAVGRRLYLLWWWRDCVWGQGRAGWRATARMVGWSPASCVIGSCRRLVWSSHYSHHFHHN